MIGALQRLPLWLLCGEDFVGCEWKWRGQSGNSCFRVYMKGNSDLELCESSRGEKHYLRLFTLSYFWPLPPFRYHVPHLVINPVSVPCPGETLLPCHDLSCPGLLAGTEGHRSESIREQQQKIQEGTIA